MQGIDDDRSIKKNHSILDCPAAVSFGTDGISMRIEGHPFAVHQHVVVEQPVG
jgi:hypothetical protein